MTSEIFSTFDTLEDIHGEKKMQECIYLRACLDESMRLSPGVGGTLPCDVLAGGMMVDGVCFPAGTDPYAYRPEWWSLHSQGPAGVDADELALQQFAYAPFSVGRASCVGKAFAYGEINIVLAHLVYLYEMRLEPGATLGERPQKLGMGRTLKKEFQSVDNCVAAHDGPMVQFKPGR
ncbi:cytochrome P450 [Halenospora varia]|nr:cytochrome P450 [Halenospora varia]